MEISLWSSWGRGFAWLDTGTHESLLQASQYIETVQRLQNVQVANLEEIAYRMGYITKEQVYELAQPLKKNEYGQYLLRLMEKLNDRTIFRERISSPQD